MRRLFCLLLPLVAAACSAASERPVPSVAIATDTQFVLPATGELGRPVDAVQQVTARHEGRVHVFEVRLQARAGQLRLAGTDPAGRRAMTIDWTDGNLAVERAPWLPETVRPENILADLVLVYWPEAALRRVLAGAGATLSAEPGSRAVRRDGRELVTVRYDNAADPWTGTARLRNLAWGYELEIRSVTLTP